VIPLVDLRAQYEAHRDELDAAILAAVGDGSFVLGDSVRSFEEEFASYCGVDECVGVASGTAALAIGFAALGIGPGDEVVAPANTFVASVVPAVQLGARVVLVDCDEQGLVDAAAVATAITQRTKAVVAVHLYGHPADADALAGVCEDAGVALVEDACQAHGARHRGRRVGGLGRFAAFSFYPSKNLGAYGDGGAITTNDGDLAARARLLRNLGEDTKYRHVAVAGNERLDELQAAVLRVKLRHLDDWNAQRRRAADDYARALADVPVELPCVAPDVEHVWHLFPVLHGQRDELRAGLAERGIGTGVHYPLPLHLQPALAELGYAEGDFPNAERRAREQLSLPMYAELHTEHVEDVASAVRELVGAVVAA
jgi:dTDP-4-amino-4,6-dideoxygalactose transaminase